MAAVALVLVQAVVGGLRVLYDSQHVGSLDTSLGRLFARLHACLAQLFACTLIAVATACSKAWIDANEPPLPDRARSLGRLCVVLLFVQLAIAAVMRHSFAGLAIPTFPASNIDGGLLPAAWDFRVGIHFAHRAMALVLCLALPWFAFTLLNVPGAVFRLRVGAAALLALLVVQVSLGAQIIWTYRAAAVTTGHVLVGALTLVTTFWLTWNAHRDAIEPKAAA